MSLWSDNFHRPNGSIGPQYNVLGGSASVSGNRMLVGGSFHAHIAPVRAPNFASMQFTAQNNVYNCWYVRPYVKANDAWTQAYYLDGQGPAATPSLQIRRFNGGSDVSLGSYTASIDPAVPHTLRLTYNAGALTAFLDGTAVLVVNDSSLAANTRLGIIDAASGIYIDELAAEGDTVTGFAISPNTIGIANAPTPITLLGANTTWTAGTPGSPLFSPSAGILSGQVLTSGSTGSATFTLPATAQNVIVTDPSSGLTATIYCVAGSGVGTGGYIAGQLSAEAAAWLDAQAAHGGLVLADNDTTGGSVSGLQLKGAFGELLLGAKSSASPSAGYVATADAILTIWGILNGQLPHESSVDVLQSVIDLEADTTDLRARWATGNDGTEWTAHELVQLLGGEPIANHQDILTAIAGVDAGDDTAVLAAIAGAKGDPLATIKTVIDQIFVLSHLGDYDLGDVKSWAEAVRGTDLPTIHSVLAKLGGSGNTIEQRVDALSDLIVTENTIQGMLNMAIAALTGGAGYTLAAVQDTVIDAINGLSFPTVSSSVRWPGLSAVTLGDPLALSDGLTIEGPMHGLLFEIARSVPGGGSYEFGTVKSWSHVGGVIFCTDGGHYERSQSIGPEHQIVMPFTMEAAESAILRLNGGFTGTVRTWTRT